MSQSGVIVTALLVGFVAWLALTGRLETYWRIMAGGGAKTPAPAANGGGSSLAPGDIAGAAGQAFGDMIGTILNPLSLLVGA